MRSRVVFVAVASCAALALTAGMTGQLAAPARAQSLQFRGPATAREITSDVTPFTVTPPTVRGPLPSPSTDFPVIADGFCPDLAAPAGYEVREDFISVNANLYQCAP